jgi:hypothetical protein
MNSVFDGFKAKQLADIHEDTELKLAFRQDRASEQSLGVKQVYI